nr:ABC transporter ATP-binding protein [Streptomyces sp. TS71-3]
MPESAMRAVRGRRMAMVFQDPQSTLNPVLTVGHQVAEALTVHGAHRAQARGRARELLEWLGIPDAERRMKDYPHQFSGGMRQRVVVAMALANNPDVLIADEPTTALDVTVQAEILGLLVRLRDHFGVSILMITHDLGVVAELCDEVMVMYAGGVVERGPVGTVLRDPAHPYTAALLRAAPRLDGARGARLPAIPGSPPDPSDLPSGCAFRPRCTLAEDRCARAVPALLPLGSGERSVACGVVQDGGGSGGDGAVGEGSRADGIATAGIAAEGSPAGAASAGDGAVADRRGPVRAEPAASGPVGSGPVARGGEAGPAMAGGRAPDITEHRSPVLDVRGLRVDVTSRGGLLGRRGRPVWAVDGVDLTIARGETMGLVAESGCGKSTLARALVGAAPVTEGEVRISPRGGTRRRGRTVQYVFQDPYGSLNPRRTVRQSLGEALDVAHAAGGRAPEERMVELLETVGLAAHHLDRRPGAFSGGQRQRVGLARALAAEPELIVCDEPVSALDVSIQAQIINLLAALRTELGLSYLFIAHDLAAVRHLSDRVAVMYLGRIVESGPADAVYSAPLHPYTAALLSSSPAPEPGGRRGERIVLRGDLPSPKDPPGGCRFRTRCPIGPLTHPERRICAEADPGLAGGGDADAPGAHRAACHFPGELSAGRGERERVSG